MAQPRLDDSRRHHLEIPRAGLGRHLGAHLIDVSEQRPTAFGLRA